MSRRLIVTVALTLWSAGSAFAEAPMVATLSTTTAKQKPVLASIIWQCEATTCTSVSTTKSSASSACRAVARRFGQVVAFTGNKGEFDQEQLAQCNKGIAAK